MHRGRDEECALDPQHRRVGLSGELGSVCAVGSLQVSAADVGLGAAGGGQASSRWLLWCPTFLPRGLLDSHFPQGLDVLEMLTCS